MAAFINNILSYFLFSVLLLFSLLPFPVLYVLSYFLYFVLYYLICYRKKVVYKNIESSFPGSKDIRKIAKRFYLHLSDTTFETVKCLTIGRKNLLKRITCDNPEIMEKLAHEKRSVIFLSAHFCNWEYLIFSMNLLFPHLAVGVGKPLSNKTMNKLLNDKRSKTGMKIINATNIKEEFAKDKDILTASLFLADQYPGHVTNVFPATFLHKDTGFLYGAEKYAKDYNYPVVYADFQRLKRGRYNIHLIEITDHPNEEPYGKIMNSYISLLEKTILRQPEYWLWSHKRWKQIPGFYK